MRLPRPAPYRSLTLITALVVLALLLLALDQAQMLGQARSYAQTFLSPVLQAFRRVGDSLNGVGAGLSDLQQLRAEVAALREENSRLEAQIIKNKTTELENQHLREQLHIQQQRPWKLVGADVSAFSPDDGRRLLLLAAGSEQGIQPGMAVIAREGGSPESLIGVVEEVGPRSAIVLLITDYSSAISAYVIRNDGTADGIVHGQWQHGSRLRLEQIDRTAALAAGDVVVTAGLTAYVGAGLPRAAIPKDVPIGSVETVWVDGRNQAAEIRPFVDPDRVRYAWVILSQDD